MPATTFTSAQSKRQHALSRWGGDSHVVRHVCVATANRGPTAPGMHTHRLTQTPAPTSNTRDCDTARRTDPPTAAHARPECPRPHSLRRKTNGNALRRDGGGDSRVARAVVLATADGGPTAPRTQACTHTGRRRCRHRRQTHMTASLREGRTHQWQRTNALRACNDIHLAQNKRQHASPR